MRANFVSIIGVLFCLLPYSCKGQINPPSKGTTFMAAPGDDVVIDWTLHNDPASVIYRSWVFISSDRSPPELLASISRSGDVTIETSNFPGLNVTATGTLILKNVRIEYNGSYEFTVVVGGTFTSVVSVFIAVRPTAGVECSTPTTVDRGDNIECSCKSTGGTPPANHSWLKNGKEIAPSSNLLSFNNVNGSINGTYTCVAQSYTLKDEASVEIKVRPNVPVMVKSFMADSPQATLGESITITCETSGRPKPNITIFHNGSSTPVSTESRYKIEKVKFEDAGRYTCVAENDFSSDSEDYTLKVGTTRRSSPTDKAETTIKNTSHTARKTGTGKPRSESKSGIEWYIIVLTLLSGIIIGLLLAYIVMRFHRWLREKNPQSKPGTPSAKDNSIYQDLNLREMNKEDNYQSLTVSSPSNYAVEDNPIYANLNDNRNKENNYQSLT